MKGARISRRGLLAGAGAVGLIGAAGTSRLSLAAAPTDKRLVVLDLQGGWDGMGMIAPYGDDAYAQARGELALRTPNQVNGVVDLNGFYGLHPAAEALLPFWNDGQLALLPAVGVGTNQTDHTTARAWFETAGSGEPGASGWLGRALNAMEAADTAVMAVGAEGGLLAGASAQRIGRAGDPVSALAAFEQRVALLYAETPLLAAAFEEAVAARNTRLNRLANDDRDSDAGAAILGDAPWLAEQAAQALSESEAHRVAVIALGGWDSHQDQGALVGPLPRRLAALAQAIALLAEALAPVWDKTVILIASEMGRAVAPNALAGTDNGVGGMALMVGGAVSGGVYGAWPGLAPNARLDGRFLAPRNSLWSAVSAILQDHLGLSPRIVANSILPNFGDTQRLEDVIA